MVCEQVNALRTGIHRTAANSVCPLLERATQGLGVCCTIASTLACPSWPTHALEENTHIPLLTWCV